MQRQNNDLAPKSAESCAGAEHLHLHRCFACLGSKHPDDRECATARLIVDGFDPKHITALYSSSKSEH